MFSFDAKYFTAGIRLGVVIISVRSYVKISIGNFICRYGHDKGRNRVVKCVCCAEIDCVNCGQKL